VCPFSYDVKDVALSSSLDKVELCVGVTVDATGAGANVEGSREVMAEDRGTRQEHELTWP
jgi:hypothetical protein